MRKFTVLTLVALGAQVNAEELAILLGERASNGIDIEYALSADLDDATLGKAAKEGKPIEQYGGKSKQAATYQQYTGPGANNQVKLKNPFGGTNLDMAGKGMPAQESAPPTPGYWGGGKVAPKATLFGGGKLVPYNGPGANNQQKLKNPFGGTNLDMAGKGMPAQEDTPQLPGFWGGQKDPRTIDMGYAKKQAAPKKGIFGKFR